MNNPDANRGTDALKGDSFLRALIERVSDGFVALDRDWRYTYVNQKAAEFLQRKKPEDLIGRHIWTEYPEGIGQPFYHAYYKAMETQEPVFLEEHYEPWDRWFENRIYPSAEGLTIYFTEITDRKRAERKIKNDASLLDSENRLLALLARNVSAQEVLIHVMRTIEAQSKGTLCSVLVLEDDGVHVRHAAPAPSLPAEYTQAIDGSKIGPEEGSCGTAMFTGKQVVATDIETDPRWQKYKSVALPFGLRACWSNPILSRTDHVLGSFAMYYREVRSPTDFEIRLINLAAHIAGIAIERERESEDRKQAEILLREREARLSSIYATVGDILFQISVESNGVFRFTSVNRAFLEVTGIKEHNIIAKRVDEVIPEPSLSFVRAKYREAIETKSIVRWEETSDYPSGRLIGEVSIAPILNAEGKCTHLIGAVHDITKHKQLQEDLRKLNTELEERVAERTKELAVAADRALHADRLKSAFLATMSHELRTPLNSILGFTGILLQGLAGPLNGEQSKQLGMARDSARHLLDLINDVLDLSRIEAGQMELSNAPFDIRASIETVIGIATPLAQKKNLSLTASIHPSAGIITSDRRRVEQILINLVNNAIKFTEKGGIVLDSSVVKNELVTTIRDTGIGIKPDQMSVLFKPFQQIESGLGRRHEGTGLGLSICKQLAELLGGRITVESQWGAGSSFSVVLPLGDRNGNNPRN